jgi:hypothetical protein
MPREANFLLACTKTIFYQTTATILGTVIGCHIMLCCSCVAWRYDSGFRRNYRISQAASSLFEFKVTHQKRRPFSGSNDQMALTDAAAAQVSKAIPDSGTLVVGNKKTVGSGASKRGRGREVAAVFASRERPECDSRPLSPAILVRGGAARCGRRNKILSVHWIRRSLHAPKFGDAFGLWYWIPQRSITKPVAGIPVLYAMLRLPTTINNNFLMLRLPGYEARPCARRTTIPVPGASFF